MDITLEIVLATVIQIGALIWLLSGLKSDVTTLKSDVADIRDVQNTTTIETAETRGRLLGLQCMRAHCALPE
jgi:hypothetical protein